MALQGTHSPRRISPRRPKPFSVAAPSDVADMLPVKLWDASTRIPDQIPPTSAAAAYCSAPEAFPLCTQGPAAAPLYQPYQPFMAPSFNAFSHFLPAPPSGSAALSAPPDSFGGSSTFPAAPQQSGFPNAFCPMSYVPFLPLGHNVPPLPQTEHLHPFGFHAGAGMQHPSVPGFRSGDSTLPFSIPGFCHGDPTLPDAAQAIANIHAELDSGIIWGFNTHNTFQGLGPFSSTPSHSNGRPTAAAGVRPLGHSREPGMGMLPLAFTPAGLTFTQSPENAASAVASKPLPLLRPSPAPPVQNSTELLEHHNYSITAVKVA